MIFLLTLCHLSVGAPRKGDLEGVVIDSEGAFISRAHVVIHADRSGNNATQVRRDDFVLETDKHGRFGATVLPGFYDLCVMADAFSPQCRKVYFDYSTGLLEFRLSIDLEIVKRLGDTVDR
jgi:hypothetical protein